MNNNNNFSINYKQDMKDCPIITRIKLLKPILEKKITQIKLANNLWIWKNTVFNAVKLFKQNYNTTENIEYIINSHKYDYDFLRSKFLHLWYKSRAPKSHSRSIKVDSSIWKQIIKLLTDTNKWYKNMNTFLLQTFKNWEYEKYNLSEAKVRWFYNKNKLTHKKLKSDNREYRSPFDFQNTLAFSRLYFDIKHIADKHALPTEIYNKFKFWIDKNSNKVNALLELPKYEFNIIEQNTRIRFMAYLTEFDSDLIFWFIELVLQFIRWNNFISFYE